MKSFVFCCLLIAVLAGATAPAQADGHLVVTGQAGVTDGDTIRMGTATASQGGQTKQLSSVRIRFYGIDAPEKAQTCLDARGEAWFCGREATKVMGEIVRGKEVSCEVRDIDRYKRLVAVCSVAGIADINAELVKRGLAVAYRQYSTDYIDEEDVARGAHLGLWAGKFDMPSDWRKTH